MDRALRDQVQGAACRGTLAKIYFQIMIAGYALILSTAEGGYGSTVECVDNIGYVLALVVDGARNSARSGDGRDSKPQGRNHEALIDKNLSAGRMINRHERNVVVIVNFP